jgi:hypothetical protein
MRQRENKSVIDRTSRVQTPRCGPTPERGVFAKTTVESSYRKAGIAENYRGSRSDPKDFGNKIQPNQ